MHNSTFNPPINSDETHHVIIVGGGFGGVRAAKALGRDKRVSVTIVDQTNHHLFQPLLYQVATGILSPGQIAPALRSMFRRSKRVRVLLGTVTEIDPHAKTVTAVADTARTMSYDTLIVAAGATHSYFGKEEWSEFAPGMKTLDDAARLRSRILRAFELAEQDTSEQERAEHLTFVVVGAGPTGVELAGQIAELAHRILPSEYRSIDTRTARIVLVDAADSVLMSFPAPLQERARKDLSKLGVKTQTGARAVAIDDHGITLAHPNTKDTTRIAARTVVWAAGVAASPLGRQLADRIGDPTVIDRAGRVKVQPNCSVPGYADVFVIGDLAYLEGVPGVAQPAMQEGRYVARVIRARLDDDNAPPPFRYRDKGNMATIGRTRAVAEIKGVNVTGFVAYVMWAVVHIAYLVGWGNRVEALMRWMWAILARNRRERLISVASLQPIHEGEQSSDVE